jgi:hypothetical protein
MFTIRLLTAVIFITLIAGTLVGQHQDAIWTLGYDSNGFPQNPGTDRIYFRFHDSLEIEYLHDYSFMPFRATNTSICDSAGNLLLLSNSCYIANGQEEYIENSDSLNPGYIYNNWCVGPDTSGYNSNNTALFLQNPGDANEYLLFHISTLVKLTPLVAYDDNLRLTRVNLSDQLVTEKNIVLIADTLDNDAMHAVRHANGRDWWIVLAKQQSNKYYIVLLSPGGILIKEQMIGVSTAYQAGGEMVFSPDGSKLARFNTRDDLRIMDFDRCTGTLSNPMHIPIDNSADIELFAGLAFSADGRFLYAAEVQRLLQFDMEAADIAASKTIIAEITPNPGCSLGKSIAYMELGPDGYIYARPLNGQRCLHRIRHPERLGQQCAFEMYYYTLDFANVGLPHFPNFRLGPIDGSACDTLGIDNVPLAGWRHDPAGGLSVEFTSVSWHEPEQWQWDFGDGAFSAERNPAHTFPAPGAYEVCLTVSNTYGSDTKCKTVWVGTSSVGEAPGRDRPQVYPNPTAGLVTIEGLASGSRIRVFDGLGRLVGEYIHQNTALDLGALPPGVYYLQCTTPDGAEVAGGKVVVGR